MRSRLGARLPRFIGIAVLAAAGLMPGVASAQTGELVMNIGTDQKLRVLNPWYSFTVADYEIFQIQYELLVGFDINLQPTAGFADDWSSSEDLMTHTFHIREGMLWSDGTPATCEDVKYTYDFVLEAVNSDRGYVGSGYLEPYLTNTGYESTECQDANTAIIRTSHPTTLLVGNYVPILPKHIWSQHTLDEIGRRNDPNFFANDQFPIVGSGPYIATSWERGSFIRMERNPNYWGEPGVADALLFQQFTGPDTMVQALQNGELDYVGGLTADLFDGLAGAENIQTVEGYSNGYTMLSFNTRATQPGYNGSTAALEDQAFRDALGFAIDRPGLVQGVLNGHGVPGSTHVPPYHVKWHVEPDNPRDFNLDTANQRLEAAGYPLVDGRRMDKQGNPITIRLTWPDSEETAGTAAQFIQGWWEQIGIGVEANVSEEGKLLEDLYGPPAGGDANWDAYIWGWVGDPDPTSLLSLFQTNQIKAGVNDCFYSDERYDQLFKDQLKATSETERLAMIDEMQQLFYDAACYHILYYDSVLHAMRTDKFTNWTNQPPAGGTPIFGYSYPGYLAVQDASAQPTAGPATPGATLAPGATPGPATPAPSAAPTGGTGGDSTPLILGAIALIIVVAGGFWFMRRRGPAVEEE